METIRLREAGRREYRDPVPFLKRLRLIEERVRFVVNDPEVRTLRTNRLKEWREARLAALFCHGFSERTGRKVFFSKGEFEDADFVACWMENGVQHFAPVQIKELVPAERNPTANLDDIFQSLRKYSGSQDLSVVIHINRRIHFDPTSITLPEQLPIAALWVLACVDPGQSQWAIWGNLLKDGEGSRFDYPA